MDDKPTRYFIISYLFGNKELGTGLLGNRGPNYPNIYELRKDSQVKNFNPINIIEVNKEDYIKFWKKDK